jgi:hypothetical protein
LRRKPESGTRKVEEDRSFDPVSLERSETSRSGSQANAD